MNTRTIVKLICAFFFGVSVLSLGSLLVKNHIEDYRIRDSLSVDEFDLEAIESSNEPETWYIVIAIDNSKDVVPDSVSEEYKNQIKLFIERLASEKLMSDETEIYLKTVLFDGNIDDNKENCTVHEIDAGESGFYRLKEGKLTGKQLDKMLEKVDFSATSTYFQGAIYGCQNILDEVIWDKTVHTMIVLLTDAYNENFGETEDNLIDQRKKYIEYENQKDSAIKKAEVVTIALNYPIDLETTKKREKGWEALEDPCKSTKQGPGVFEEGSNYKVVEDSPQLERLSSMKLRKNYAVVEDSSQLEAALWEICNYISSKLEKIQFTDADYETHGVESAQLYMIKPERAKIETVMVKYGGETKDWSLPWDLYNREERYTGYCETIQLAKDINGTVLKDLKITCGGQIVDINNVYVVYEGLKYDISCTCRGRRENDNGIKQASLYIGEISLQPKVKRRNQEDNELEAEFYISNKPIDWLNSEPECISDRKNDGSYDAQVPIIDYGKSLYVIIHFFSKNKDDDSENKDDDNRFEHQTISTVLKWPQEGNDITYAADRVIHVKDIEVSAGRDVTIELDKGYPWLQLHDISLSEHFLQGKTEEESAKVTLKTTGGEDGGYYEIKGKDKDDNEWTVTGKIMVQKDNLDYRIAFIIPAIAILIVALMFYIYRRLMICAKITVINARKEPELVVLIRNINKFKNMEKLIESLPCDRQNWGGNLTSISVKQCFGRIVVIDHNSEDTKHVEHKTILKEGELYSVNELITVSVEKRN